MSGVPLTSQTTVIMADRLEIRHSYCTGPGMADEPTRKDWSPSCMGVCVSEREREREKARETETALCCLYLGCGLPMHLSYLFVGEFVSVYEDCLYTI